MTYATWCYAGTCSPEHRFHNIPLYSIIKKFARKDIAHLGDLIAVISELSRGERVPLEYVTYNDRHRKKVGKYSLAALS